MTTEPEVARRKLSTVELAQDLGSVSGTCRMMGCSPRQQFHVIRRNFQLYGSERLIDRLPGSKGPHPNRVGQEVEEEILAHCLRHPTHGCVRTAQAFALRGIRVNSMGVRRVWFPQDLTTRHQRLLRLAKEVLK